MVDGGVFSLEELTVWWWKGDGDFKCLHCPKSWECYFLSLPLSPSHGFLFCLSIFFTFPWIILCLLPLNPVHFHLLNHSHIRLILEFLPCGSDGKKICLQCGRPGFDPWIRKIPWSKEMATHSRILVRRIPWTQEPGGLQFTGSQRVGRDWATKHSTVKQKDSIGMNNSTGGQERDRSLLT